MATTFWENIFLYERLFIIVEKKKLNSSLKGIADYGYERFCVGFTTY